MRGRRSAVHVLSGARFAGRPRHFSTPGDVTGGTLYVTCGRRRDEPPAGGADAQGRRAEDAAGLNPADAPPPIDDFLRDVDAHAASLGRTIKVAGEALDRSIASLGAVDKALKRIRQAGGRCRNPPRRSWRTSRGDAQSQRRPMDEASAAAGRCSSSTPRILAAPGRPAEVAAIENAAADKAKADAKARGLRRTTWKWRVSWRAERSARSSKPTGRSRSGCGSGENSP